MPRIIESPPPYIIGHAEISTGLIHGDFVALTYANEQATVKLGNLPSDAAQQNLQLADVLSPLWLQTDNDYRNLHGLDESIAVRHLIDIKTDRGIPGFSDKSWREIIGGERLLRPRKHPGITHIDGAMTTLAHPRARYTMSTSEPTEFLIGHRWFIPFNYEAGGDKSYLPRALVKTLLNSVFLLPQIAYAVPVQPNPGDIARVDNRVHRAACRPRTGDGITILDSVGVDL